MIHPVVFFAFGLAVASIPHWVVSLYSVIDSSCVTYPALVVIAPSPNQNQDVHAHSVASFPGIAPLHFPRVSRVALLSWGIQKPAYLPLHLVGDELTLVEILDSQLRHYNLTPRIAVALLRLRWGRQKLIVQSLVEVRDDALLFEV